MHRVIIRGDGIAAYCCAHLLKAAGIRVSLDQTDRPRLPAIMLGEAALALIRDVFEQDDLFRDLPRIEKRVVAWGPNSTPVALDHSAVERMKARRDALVEPLPARVARLDLDLAEQTVRLPATIDVATLDRAIVALHGQGGLNYLSMLPDFLF